MVRHNCHGISISTHPLPVYSSYTGEECVEMDIPWQLCWTMDPLTLHSQEIGCALALDNMSFCLSSEPMVQHKCIYVGPLVHCSIDRKLTVHPKLVGILNDY